MREHEHEPVRGLPERLPAEEAILWQGSPSAMPLAMSAFHLRGLAFYFALLAVWRIAASWADGATTALAGAAWILLLGLVAIAVLAVIGWLTARTTLYTITTRRVVMRVGVAVSLTVNIPFAAIRSADLRLHGAGHGDIRLLLAPGHRASWIALWPHLRPWRVARPEPVLRALPDAELAGQVLARALAAAAAMPAPVLQEAAEAARRPIRPEAAAAA